YSPNHVLHQIYEEGFNAAYGQYPIMDQDFSMGRGRGRRRKQRRNGSNISYWNIPHSRRFHPGDMFGFYPQAQAAHETWNEQSSKMEYMLPRSRMVEPHRMGDLHRQLAHQTGRRFGVPGFVAGQPG